jgi:hypothetical protein
MSNVKNIRKLPNYQKFELSRVLFYVGSGGKCLGNNAVLASFKDLESVGVSGLLAKFLTLSIYSARTRYIFRGIIRTMYTLRDKI